MMRLKHDILQYYDKTTAAHTLRSRPDEDIKFRPSRLHDIADPVAASSACPVISRAAAADIVHAVVAAARPAAAHRRIHCGRARPVRQHGPVPHEARRAVVAARRQDGADGARRLGRGVSQNEVARAAAAFRAALPGRRLLEWPVVSRRRLVKYAVVFRRRV